MRLLRMGDTEAPSDYTAYSSLRSRNEFISKRNPDAANELITFLKGLLIGKNGSGITVLEDGTSQAVVDRLYVKINWVEKNSQFILIPPPPPPSCSALCSL